MVDLLTGHFCDQFVAIFGPFLDHFGQWVPQSGLTSQLDASKMFPFGNFVAENVNITHRRVQFWRS